MLRQGVTEYLDCLWRMIPRTSTVEGGREAPVPLIYISTRTLNKKKPTQALPKGGMLI